jgi:hypothetical protein
MHPMVFMLIPLAMVGLGLLLASNKRGAVGRTRIGARCLELRSVADAQLVFDRIRGGVGAPYRIDDLDPEHKTLVLSSPPTLATWGFLYPITITANGTGSLIQIGIESRFIQLGPLVTRAHTRCSEMIEALVGIPAARVATR